MHFLLNNSTIDDQFSNQAANFTAYQFFKSKWQELSGKPELAPWQHMLIGGISGGFGPSVNNPLDVVKTRMQRQVVVSGQRPRVSLFSLDNQINDS